MWTLHTWHKNEDPNMILWAGNISTCLNDFESFVGIGPDQAPVHRQLHCDRNKNFKKLFPINNYIPFHPRRPFLEIQGHISALEHLNPLSPLPKVWQQPSLSDTCWYWRCAWWSLACTPHGSPRQHSPNLWGNKNTLLSPFHRGLLH